MSDPQQREELERKLHDALSAIVLTGSCIERTKRPTNGHRNMWSASLHSARRDLEAALAALDASRSASPPVADRPSTVSMVAPGEGLREEVARLRLALEEIANPLTFMQQRAYAEGNRLSGLAYSIATNAGYLQRIALAALSHPKGVDE